ncbi:MAG: hypothetical protein H0T53_12245 [Herpetosiphonaceae bacterium]|nr:hypothetical protein [Herpetosiphonaceae bacterium]
MTDDAAKQLKIGEQVSCFSMMRSFNGVVAGIFGSKTAPYAYPVPANEQAMSIPVRITSIREIDPGYHSSTPYVVKAHTIGSVVPVRPSTLEKGSI